MLLDASRWVAAWLVVLNHVRHLVLVDLPLVRQPSPFDKALYLVSGLGHEAVMVFFVISGYLVGGVTLSKWRKAGTDLPGYAAARISRIYTVLVPALLTGACLDALGLRCFDASGLYSRPDTFHSILMTEPVALRLTVPVFLQNLLALQHVTAPVFGSNGPLWSLAYEIWYYIMFALLGTAVLGQGRLQRTACACIAACLLWLLPSYLWLLGLSWCFGVAAKWLGDRKRPAMPIGLPVAAVLFLAAAVSSRLSHSSGAETMMAGLTRDWLVGLAYALLLVASQRSEVSGRSVPVAAGIHSHLAAFSFSLYLYHFPMLWLLAAIAHDVVGIHFPAQPSALAWLTVLVECGLLILASLALSLLTERNTPAVRASLQLALRRLRAREFQAGGPF